MNVLILGSGGREHALAWKIAASPLADKIYCAPGNAGIAQEAECVALDLADHKAVIAFCRANTIDFVVVGPEVPLVAGIADDLEAAGIKTFGPSKWAARLEGSKGFTKDLCKANKIPTAAYERFKSRRAGERLCAQEGRADRGEGRRARRRQRRGGGGNGRRGGSRHRHDVRRRPRPPAWEIVIEDCLVGEEASFFALCDGETAIALASAQDHKRVGDGDKGPNTGGMGAYSPAPIMTADMNRRVMDEIIQPTVRALKAMGAPYKGVLFAGLMITKDGPQLIEYNVRFGDPECQVLMLRLKSDLLPALIAARDGQLKHFDLRWYDDAALTVVMAAKGYPGNYAKGSIIEGPRRGGASRGCGNLSRRHQGRRRTHSRQRRARAQYLRARRDCGEAQQRAYAAIDRIKLAGRILPPRHRLARDRARKTLKFFKFIHGGVTTLSSRYRVCLRLWSCACRQGFGAASIAGE